MEKRKVVIKSDEKRLVIAEVYSPLDVDSQGEAMTAEEIEKAAHLFLSKGLVDNIDESHSREKTGCVIVESFIVDKNDSRGLTEGAWAVCVHVAPDDLWQKVKSGELNGFSFSGSCSRMVVPTYVEMPVNGRGETEESTGGVLPPHKHFVEVKFDSDGKIIPTTTQEFLSHTHRVSKATATESSFGHSHRLIFGQE